MADINKCFDFKLGKGDEIKIIYYNSLNYVLYFEKGTAAPTTFYHSSALNTALTGVSVSANTLKAPLETVVTASEYIKDNVGNIYYKIYADVYEDDANGLVGVHPKGRRPL